MKKKYIRPEVHCIVMVSPAILAGSYVQNASAYDSTIDDGTDLE